MKKPKTLTIICVDNNNIHALMMEKFFEKILKEKNIEAVVFSVSTNIRHDMSLNTHLLQIMNKYDFDISDYLIKPIDKYFIEKFDYVFCCDVHIKNQLIKKGLPANKINILSEDIPNPFGKNITSYTSCAELIEMNISRSVDKMNLKK
jgi:protein-tyrosine-phosphatase